MIKLAGYVLLSGGVDSSTCLAFAIRDCGRENVKAISIDYGQRHIKEMDQAKKVAAYFSVPHEVHPIIGIPKAGLTDHNAYIPNASYSELQGVSPTYVPFRNGQLISRIAGIASHEVESTNMNKFASDDPNWEGRIYFGAHAEDAAGDAYPDCRLDFVGAMAAAVYIGTYHLVRLNAPLISMYKDEIVQAGEKMHVPWHLTWSCYKGEEKHCGICPTCRARKDGFKKAGVKDPTEYQVEAGKSLDDIPF
jgi:7-cyano-7-deazaguanine synthase